MALTINALAVRTAKSTRVIDATANAAVLAALWFVYAAVRNVTTDTRDTALGNASRLLELEAALRIDVESAVQSAVDWPHAFMAANAYYLVHFPLTLAVMALAFWRSRGTIFPVVRNALVGCTAAALVVHLFIPMAPPRMLPGFIDAGVAFGPDPYAVAGSSNANQFAAMPSMHVAWSILCAFAIWHLSAGRATKAVAALHPLITTAVVVLTGHHFVTDGAIGAFLAVVMLAAATRLSIGRRDRADWTTPSSQGQLSACTTL